MRERAEPEQKTDRRDRAIAVTASSLPRSRNSASASFAMLAWAVMAIITSELSTAGEATHEFNIPAQSLNNALMALAGQTKMALIFTADSVRGLRSQPLVGRMPVSEGLSRLLQGSGFGYRYVDATTVTLEKQSAAGVDTSEPLLSTMLDKITVVGRTEAKPSNSYIAEETSSGTRTNTPLREIPRSIHPLTKALMNDQQTVTLSETLRNVSSVVPGSPLLTPSFEATLIRGFRSEYLLDGFTQYYNPGDRESEVNVEGIEVLKGPNAVLYGGGSGSPASGVINLLTKQPKPNPFGELGIKIGTREFYQAYADINQPLSSQVLFRITGEFSHAGSYVDTLQTQRYNINPVLTVTDNDTTNFTLQAKVSRWAQPDYQGLPGTGTVAGGFKIDPKLFIGPDDLEDSRSEFTGVWGTLAHRFSDAWSFTARARYARSQFRQRTQGIWGSDGFSANWPLLPPSTWGLYNSQLFQKQSEVSVLVYAQAEFEWGPSQNKFLMGGDYSQLDDAADLSYGPLLGLIDLQHPEFTIPYSLAGSSTNRASVGNTISGGYLQLQSDIEPLHLLASLRLGNVAIDFRNDSSNISQSTHSTRLLPHLGTTLDVIDGVSLFAGYSTGMRGQPYVNFAGSPQPELSEQIEGGFKFSLFHGLQGQLAAYRIHRSNVGGYYAVDARVQATRLFDQRSRGLEADLVWQSEENEFSVLLNYAHTLAEGGINLRGMPDEMPLPGVPRHSGRLWLIYRFQQPEFKGLSLGCGVYAQSGTSLAAGSGMRSDSFFSVDATGAYETDRFKLGVAIKNLTNESYFDRLSYIGGRAVPAQGASVIFTAALKF